MKAKKITTAEIDSCKVSALPTRPTSTSLYGGPGYSANDLKAAFDKLPLLLVEHFNALIDDISAKGDASISSAILTNIYQGHSLADLFGDITNGNTAAYLDVGGKSLASELYEIKEAIRALGGDI